jgi:hypothetical protein
MESIRGEEGSAQAAVEGDRGEDQQQREEQKAAAATANGANRRIDALIPSTGLPPLLLCPFKPPKCTSLHQFHSIVVMRRKSAFGEGEYITYRL